MTPRLALHPRRLLPYGWFLVAYVAAFGLLWAVLSLDGLDAAPSALRPLLWLRWGFEVGASTFVFATLLKCVEYLCEPGGNERRPGPVVTQDASPAGAVETRPAPAVAVVYLCAGDLDGEALESLCELDYDGPYTIFVHDDSREEAARRKVDDTVRRLRQGHRRPIEVLRRGSRSGGKPGAMNNVLRCLGDRYPYILLCDNDSIAIDRDAIPRTLPRFDDADVAAVQFRTVGVTSTSTNYVERLLGETVEVFDLFASHQARHGLMPFLGHNGILRTAAVREVGGFREGCLADDIDVSVAFALRGWRVHYARDIRFGERHPGSYRSFRLRAGKWAAGCGQVLRRHGAAVLGARRLSVGQKLGFLEFTAFYLVQLLLVAYLAFSWLVLPWWAPELVRSSPGTLLAGGAVAGSIFLPVLTYRARRARLRGSLRLAWIAALVYGSTAFVSFRGVLRGLTGRPLPWKPTNAGSSRRGTWPAVAGESLFGAALLGVPILWGPGGPLQPLLYLFSCVFLLTPLFVLTYDPAFSVAAGPRRPGRLRRATRGWGLLLVAAATISLAMGGSGSGEDPGARVALSDGGFVVDGQPYPVKGIHYSPWPPGTGPMKDHEWPDDRRIRRDLQLIAETGANTILVHDADPTILGLAREQGLMVIYAFYINWQSIDDEAGFERRTDEIRRVAGEMAGHPALLAILLGNEVVEWVLDTHGNELIEGRLRELYGQVKAVAPHVPVSHSNWPVTKSLDLDFMDYVAFNLYSSWPREVVVKGYGLYIQDVLLPIANGRPLLITEFGQNALEASEEKQAEVLRECWTEIEARTAGGVVFSFADEWWKNYDNPITEGEWWQREYAPDDEKTHDLDPEEYYGIFTSDRVPKPAAAAVREMFQEPGYPRWIFVLPIAVLVLYTGILVLRGSRTDGSGHPGGREAAR